MHVSPATSLSQRRSFLRHMACGAGVAAAAKFAEFAQAGTQRWAMRIAGSTINFASLPFEQACQRIAQLGCEAIDIWSAQAGCPHLDDVQTRLGPSGLQEVLARNKLKLYAFSVYRGGYAKYAQLLGKIGGGVAVRGSAGKCDPKELTARMRGFLESIKPEAELAEQYNSYVAVENHGGALLNSLDSLKAFVDLNRHPRLGIALAPYHVQAEKASVAEAIRTVGKQLLFFYAWQNAPGVGQLPGHGPADCVPWIAALAQTDYKYYVTPFLHHEPSPDQTSAALAKSIRYLQECYAKAAP